MFSDIARLLIETAAALLGAAFVLRLYMNWVGMPTRNPLAQFIIAVTDWAIRPLRRVLPPAGRLDTASIVAALILALLALAMIDLVSTGLVYWDRALIRAPGTVLRWALNLVMWMTIFHIIISWVNPHAPLAPAISMLVRPFLAPFQRIIPLVGGFDLSPLGLILVVQILLLILNRSGL